MNLDAYFQVGITVDLGSHTFQPDEIKAFAAKYDPQPFHLDEEKAAKSVFGRLCASGWHTCAMWMRHNLETRERLYSGPWEGQEPRPEFGPSAGISDLKWLRPVYAGETIRFSRMATSHRPLASRPGWHMLSVKCEAFVEDGPKVLEFDSAILVKAGMAAA